MRGKLEQSQPADHVLGQCARRGAVGGTGDQRIKLRTQGAQACSLTSQVGRRGEAEGGLAAPQCQGLPCGVRVAVLRAVGVALERELVQR